MDEGVIGSSSGEAVNTWAESRLDRPPGGGGRHGGRRLRRLLASGQPGAAAAVTGVVAVSVWRGSLTEAIAIVALIAVGSRRWTFALGLAALAGFAMVRGNDARAGLVPDHLGPFAGWVTVVDDPRPFGSGTRVILQIDGERFEMWVRGRAGQLRVAGWQGGDAVWVDGARLELDPQRAGRVAWQHVVGGFQSDSLGDRRHGRPLAVASNRVRGVIGQATAVLAPDDAALARGLIIGDDTTQPRAMIERFRTSGMSHLTAVSGQNVAFVLAAAGPLLRRAPPATRLVASLALIAWFVVITRAEPSVLRAGVMAGLGAVAFTLGREREPFRLLAVAAAGLLIVDPLLVYSVGFWLSVGATAGVTVIGPALGRRLTVLGPLAVPVGITIGAQIGVVVPSVLVFGRLSLVGTVANLIAVPVAGFVMLYGLPACLVAGALPVLARPLMLPVGAGVRIVDTVATVAAHLEPPTAVGVVGWVALVAVVGGLAWRGGVGCRIADDQMRQ